MEKYGLSVSAAQPGCLDDVLVEFFLSRYRHFVSAFKVMSLASVINKALFPTICVLFTMIDVFFLYNSATVLRRSSSFTVG